MSWPRIFKIGVLPEDGPVRRRRPAAWAKAAVSFGLLAYLFSRVDAGNLVEVLRNFHGGYFTLALFGYLLLQFASILRWRVMARVQGYGHSYRQLTAFYYCGLFFSLFLPTTIGGDLGRCYYLADNRRDLSRAVTTVLADRISGTAAVILIAAVALLAGSPVEIPFWLQSAVIGGAGLLVLGLWIPFAAPAFFGKFETPFRYWKNPAAMTVSLGLSFFIQLAVVFINMLIGLAVGADIPWGFYFVFTPLVNVAAMFPASLNGLGVREGAYVYFLHQAGLSASHALTFAVCWLILITATSLLGGLIWVFTNKSRDAVKS